MHHAVPTRKLARPGSPSLVCAALSNSLAKRPFMTSAPAAIVQLYERHAATYDGLRGKALFERPWLDRFRALLKPGGSILDIGCGSGEPIARHLIAEGHAITGVDSAPAMIALCEARFPAHRW